MLDSHLAGFTAVNLAKKFKQNAPKFTEVKQAR